MQKIEELKYKLNNTTIMTERFASDLLFILVALLVAAALGLIIGYLWGKRIHLKCVVLENEIEELKNKLRTCNQEKEKLLPPFDAVAAEQAFMKKIPENDLTLVEGIGEKIEAILKKRGIDTWRKLAQTADEEIKNILLTDGGPSYAVHEPKTWSTQALLAYQGRWAQLKEYQDLLIGGK
jgi:predicted flap endonuclease-1-like 5' DNA nuclease